MKIRTAFGSEYVLVPQGAVLSLDEAAARALLDEAAAVGGNDAALVQLAGGELGDADERRARLDALARALADGTLVAIADEHEARLVPPTADGQIVDWDGDHYVPLAELLPSTDTSTPAVAATEPALLRLELGALGFDELGVLTLPRARAGPHHPWAALTILA
ncbi:MAG: hypothetical protein IAG13_05960, partial [Deltaproteobacteria bacterium]|nr:hypothetical protein [Nannocystaceae bacterium]